MQLTEDHTLLARLLAAGVDVDTSNEGARFKSMLTNALGIGHECKVATFIVPVADGDRFLLCSDGITEYVQEVEIGEVLTSQPSPARAAQKLVELALQRGGADNATALVVKVVEAGETARPAAQLAADNAVIASCTLWAKSTPQGRLRALRIALPREHAVGERIPAQTLGDRVAWLIVEGEVEQERGVVLGPGALLYPEALAPGRALPDKEGLGIVAKAVRALALRADDFRELCEDDTELGEQLVEALTAELDKRAALLPTGDSTRAETVPIDDKIRDTAVGMGVVADEPPAFIEAHTQPGLSSKRVAPAPARTRSTDPGMAATLPPIKRVPAPAMALPARQRPSDPPVSVGRTPTPPMGATLRAPSPPVNAEADAIARGPTDPQISVPAVARTATEKRPALHKAPAFPRPQTPPIAFGDGELDQVFSDLTDGMPRPRKPAAVIVAPPASRDDSQPEITIEADAPPRVPNRHTKPTVRVEIDNDDPEISIERVLEMDVDSPMSGADDDSEPEITMEAGEPDDSESSQPEIVVIHAGRPITANDGPNAAGTIDTAPRAKRT